MKKVIFLLALSLVSFSVCDAQSTTKAKMKKTKTGRIAWRLMLDFKSKGAGIDNATWQKIEGYTNSHPKKPAFNVIQKGKEGEKKVYFGLAELSDDEQYQFVDEVRNLIPDRKMVGLETTLPKRKAIPGLTTTLATDQQVETKYRLVISFISKGAGTDHNARKQVLDLIEKQAKKPMYEARIWGREGEEDFIFTLKELNLDEQKVFVGEVKKLVSNSDLVLIKENEIYVKKGR